MSNEIKGHNVNYVTHSKGVFRQVYGKYWIEEDLNKKPTFNFVETHRDEFSVYLTDSSRNVKIMIDTFKKVINYGEGNSPLRLLYSIDSATVKKIPVKKLRIDSVKCVKPSSGIDDVARGIFGTIGGIIGGVAYTPAVGASGGILIGGTGLAVAAGASTGVATIEGLAHVFGGSDDLYITVNGTKVWPAGKYVDIDSQQQISVGLEYTLDHEITIGLREYDTMSADDDMGYHKVDPRHLPGTVQYLIEHKGEGSLYEINYTVSEV